ncbi:MAG: VOC family protein, partial [Brevibacterium sp.]
EIGSRAEAAGHHPDVTLTFPHVDIRLTSHDTGAVTERDLDLAKQISEAAASAGVSADPEAPVVLELGLDTAHKEAIAPFWAALLTGDAGNVSGDDVVDPSGQVPLLWFQECEEHDVPHQRLHVDISVAPELADRRIRAAVAAGGTVVDDSPAPRFTVLADADGNRACVCTLATRP